MLSSPKSVSLFLCCLGLAATEQHSEILRKHREGPVRVGFCGLMGDYLGVHESTLAHGRKNWDEELPGIREEKQWLILTLNFV